ncbi:hypothetical protein RKD18_000023 [Streptomyces phaeoluteigriseus]
MTTLHITTGHLLGLMLCSVAAYAVYFDTKRRSTQIPATGDVGAAIAAFAVVGTLLVSIGLGSAQPNSAVPPDGGFAPTCSSITSRC